VGEGLRGSDLWNYKYVILSSPGPRLVAFRPRLAENDPFARQPAGNDMRLLDHFTHSGDLLFRWRGQLPLLLLPAFVLALVEARLPAQPTPALRAWQVASVLVALSGLVVRVIAIGTAPTGTSERSTTNPRASMLRTTGLYSVVRHPLYVGNTLTAAGLACFTGAWYLPLLVVLAGVLYHERICAREEAFLEGKFGDEFRVWADRVPAAVPRLSGYVPSATPFVWRRVLGREYHGLMVIGAAVFVLDLVRSWAAAGRLVFDPVWTAFFAFTSLLFVGGSLLKKTTTIFREENRGEGVESRG
jgi:protein-S-isoprenylcysteine O-methyltransferase Ste14